MKTENHCGASGYLGRVAGKSKAGIAVLALIQTVLGLSGVCSALLLRSVINAAMAGERGGFYFYITALIVLFCVQLLLQAVNRLSEEYTRSALENRLKRRLFSALLNKEYGAVAAVHSGEWMNRLTSDTVIAADGMVQIFPGLCGMTVKVCSVRSV